MRALSLVYFSFLLLAACKDSDSDSESDGASTPSCTYPDSGNPSECPAKYDVAQRGATCPREGLVCSYPGAGDGRGDGCWGTAQLSCRADPVVDGGVAQSPKWRAAQ